MDEIDSQKRKVSKTYHGLENHLAYQEAMKVEATVACSLVFVGLSMNVTVLQMVDALRAKDVVLSRNTCVAHIKTAIDNGGIGMSPQNPVDCALPSAMKERFSASVKALRRMKFPFCPMKS